MKSRTCLKQQAVVLVFLMAVISSCQKEVETKAATAIPAEVLAKIQNNGFGITSVQAVEDGYLVEGDILLTEDFLQASPGGTLLRVGAEEQYHTTNLVHTNGVRTITVALDNKLKAKAGYNEGLAEMVRRYNVENLLLNFKVVSSGADITFQNANGSYLASAGFPSGGNPYNVVKVNSKAIGNSSSSSFIDYLATILAHEAGHCIGFRHTDYKDRSYSCGGAVSNEGASTVGAILIPGTPSEADPNSWMLACIGSGVNRPFNTNDKTALDYLY